MKLLFCSLTRKLTVPPHVASLPTYNSPDVGVILATWLGTRVFEDSLYRRQRIKPALQEATMNGGRMVITGANGMIGGRTLQFSLDRNDVSKLTVIGRRSVGIQNPKLNEVVHTDYSHYGALGAEIDDQDISSTQSQRDILFLEWRWCRPEREEPTGLNGTGAHMDPVLENRDIRAVTEAARLVVTSLGRW